MTPERHNAIGSKSISRLSHIETTGYLFYKVARSLSYL